MSKGGPEVLGERVVSQKGSLEKVEQFLSGHHPHLGRLHQGWRGNETIQTVTRLKPTRIITVK